VKSLFMRLKLTGILVDQEIIEFHEKGKTFQDNGLQKKLSLQVIQLHENNISPTNPI
jgi:hypothetical protein